MSLRPGTIKVMIGRNSDADIRLDLPTVSRRHAVVKLKNDKFYISDCDSLKWYSS